MRLLILAATIAMPALANATTIDFNGANQNMLFGPSYSEDGYTLTGSGFVFPQSDGWAYSSLANDGSLTLNYKGPTYTLTKDGGGLFDVTSFQLGNVNGSTFGGTLQVSLDGGAFTSFAIPLTNALQTYALNGIGVSSVAFAYLPGETANNTLNSYARLDNIVVNAAGAVPEPATWAMMMAGFGMVGMAARRRSTRRMMSAI